MSTLLNQPIRAFKKRKGDLKKGFTLVEMLIVLLVVSVLILLFVPNMAQQRETIDDKGNAAIVQVVETQIELFRLENNRAPNANELVDRNYVSAEQYQIYQNRPSGNE
ncbi:MAG TPA: competence protein ComG [Enterococcus sp.]|nr:competence protein ComG [Enterococcus sp.]